MGSFLNLLKVIRNDIFEKISLEADDTKLETCATPGGQRCCGRVRWVGDEYAAPLELELSGGAITINVALLRSWEKMDI
jgi:hypothetical protein